MEKFKRLFSDRNMFIVFAFGFSSGLPLWLTGSTLQAWLTMAGVSLTSIGFASLLGLPYSLKFIWSPLLDRYTPPFLGRRRGWIAISQIGVVISLIALSLSNPESHLAAFAAIAIIVAFCSATQDIGIDAHRRETLPMEQFGLGSAFYMTAYRLSMYVGSAGALLLAAFMPWNRVYLIMAAIMGLTLLVTLFSKEPTIEHAPPRSMKEAVVDPFVEFFSRKGAIWILLFILLYKVGDNMASAMTTSLYIRELKFTTAEIAGVVKIFGVWATIGGGVLGGAAMLYIGLKRSLWIFGILQAVSTLSFAWLAIYVPGVTDHKLQLLALTFAITAENLTGGMGTAAYATFMASQTNKRFTATQYALLTSLMSIPRNVAGGPTGWIAEQYGWVNLFLICTLAAIPGLLLLFKVGKWADAHDGETVVKNDD